MRRRKRKLSIFKILALILFLASLFMSYIIYKVNLLPNKYLYLVLGGIVFINIFFDIFLMRKKARKGVRGFFAFLTIVVLGVMAFFAHYILNTLGFLAKIGPTDYKTETYINKNKLWVIRLLSSRTSRKTYFATAKRNCG